MLIGNEFSHFVEVSSVRVQKMNLLEFWIKIEMIDGKEMWHVGLMLYFQKENACLSWIFSPAMYELPLRAFMEMSNSPRSSIVSCFLVYW